MNIYLLDSEGVLVGEEFCQESPLEPGKFLFPSDKFTTVPPPSHGSNEVPVLYGDEWKIVPDFRGEIAWSKVNGEQLTISRVGDVPQGYTLIPPLGLEHPVFSEDKGWEEDARAVASALACTTRKERNKLLAEAQNRIDRYNNQRRISMRTDDTRKKYKEILRYMQQLRDVPTQQGFPYTVDWPRDPTKE